MCWLSSLKGEISSRQTIPAWSIPVKAIWRDPELASGAEAGGLSVGGRRGASGESAPGVLTLLRRRPNDKRPVT
jgi:hypothetical protein